MKFIINVVARISLAYHNFLIEVEQREQSLSHLRNCELNAKLRAKLRKKSDAYGTIKRPN